MSADGGWLRTRWRRFEGEGRLAGIDMARGAAVIGMFAAHMLALPDLAWADPSTWAGAVDGRPSILFATLAGVSIALFSGGRHPRATPDVRIRLLVRAGLIWALGIALSLMPVPIIVILPAYAVLFLCAIAVLGWAPRALFSLAAAIAVAGPFAVQGLNALGWRETAAGGLAYHLVGWNYPFVLWAAFVAGGMAIGRLRVRRLRVQVRLLLVGAGLALVGDGIIAPLAAAAGTGDGASASGAEAGVLVAALSGEPHGSGLGEAIGSGGFAIAAIGASLLVCRTPLRWPAIPLRAVGAMPLTAYTAQFAVWWAATAGADSPLAGFHALDPFAPFALATLAGCTAWTLLVGRGPLEWALDRVSRAAARARSVA